MPRVRTLLFRPKSAAQSNLRFSGSKVKTITNCFCLSETAGSKELKARVYRATRNDCATVVGTASSIAPRPRSSEREVLFDARGLHGELTQCSTQAKKSEDVNLITTRGIKPSAIINERPRLFILFLGKIRVLRHPCEII